jgi:hypothetical protein
MSLPAPNLPTPNRRSTTRPTPQTPEPERRRPHGHEMPEEPRRAGALRRPKGAEGAKRPLRREAPRAPTPSPRRKKKHHLGFAVFASTIVGLMVFGVVVLNVLLAQQSFRIDEAERRLEILDRDHLELVRERATLSAPDRIAAWADRHGMRLPDDIRILRAPSGPVDPAGAATSSQDGV